MKINTKEVLRSFKGEVLKEGQEELTLGMAIANILSVAKEGGKYKLFILAEKFYMEKEVEVDAADLALVKKAAETSEFYTNIVAGQVLRILSKVEEKK